MKKYIIQYEEKVIRTTRVEANSKKEAKEMFENDDFEQGELDDIGDNKLIYIEETDDEEIIEIEEADE